MNRDEMYLSLGVSDKVLFSSSERKLLIMT